MEEQENKKSNTVDNTINAVANLTKEIPIYQDAIQPAAKQVGKSLETVGKAVNTCLAPIRGLVWGAEQIEKFMNNAVSEKLKDVPEENIETPDPHIAGPLIESLRFTGNNEELKNMYASLLATSMNSDTKDISHPSFVDIIKNLTSDEAKIIMYLSENINSSQPMINIYQRYDNDKVGENIRYKYVSDISDNAGTKFNKSSYFDNLLRLKLIEIPFERFLTKDHLYDELLNADDVKKAIEDIDNLQGFKSRIEKTFVRLTDYGKQFAVACK